MKKAGWLKDAIARPEGYFDSKGNKLKGARLTQEQCDDWNGVKKAAKKIELKIEEEAPAEVTEVTVEVEEKPSVSKKRKK
jgi:hypothetical protein